MNGYELSRNWFDWCFENPEKISPNHSALYFFAIEHCNRLGWRKKFGFPTEMAKDAIGIKSYTTYIKTLNDLVDFGFIEMIERSKNQYSSNIVALTNFDKALDKALDKAIVKHVVKHSESTCESNVTIDKPLTINNETKEPKTNITPLAIFTFSEFWSLYPNKVAKDKCEKKYENLSNQDKVKIKNTLRDFLDTKPFAEYNHPNPYTYLNQKRWNDEVKKESSTFAPDNEHNEEIVTYYDNVNPTRRQATRSKFEIMKVKNAEGGYIYTEVPQNK